MTRWMVPALILAALAAASRLPTLGTALHIAFALASAAPIGGVFLLAIARLTGTDWSPAAPHTRALPWLIPLAALAMLSATGTPLPPHLSLWANPLFTATRAAIALAALTYAAHHLRNNASPTFAAITLTIYAAVVTPIAADWLLPTAPGHPASAVGMMLFLLQFAAACALGLPKATGRTRSDLALLLIAALLGLCYLGFVDYLIIWFGNLPERVPFYLARDGWLALTGILVGLAGTIAAVITHRHLAASLTAAAGLALFTLWWIAPSPLAALLALAATTAFLYALNRQPADA